MVNENVCDKCHQRIRPKTPKRLYPWCCYALIWMSRTVSEKRLNEFNRRQLEGVMGHKLDHGTYANFTTLGKNGLIAKVFFLGQRKSGYWCITRKGYRFLRGVAVPDCVWTWEREIVARSPILKTISQIMKETPYAPSLKDILIDYPEPDIDDNQIALPTFIKLDRRGKALCPKCGKPMRSDQDGHMTKDVNGGDLWQYTGKPYWNCVTCSIKIDKEAKPV